MAAESLWKLGGLSPKELCKRVWHEIDEDEIFSRAAALAYYFVLAMFPMMLFIAAILGLMASSGKAMEQTLMQYLMSVLPGSASGVVQKTVEEITKASSGGKLSFGIIFTLWSASAGMAAIMDALNACYHVRESRGLVKSRVIALGLTVAVSVLVLAALTLFLAGGRIVDHLGAAMHMGPMFAIGWKIVQWPLAIFFMVLAFALVYYFAPDIKEQHWEWITPGAVGGLVLWILASFGVKVYLHFSNSYTQYYGSLGGAMILLLWLYVSGAALLIGGEFNSEIENAAAKRLRDPEAKAAGEKAPGEKPEARQPRREHRPAA